MLEGKYFGRNTKINHYLQKYNIIFDQYEEILSSLLNSIDIINKLRLSEKSYWFNKANLFTLIIEFSKIEIEKIDFELLESKLLELEKKVDIYFTDEDISMISDDERKYFEYARQGSHEYIAREHRGKIIQKLLNESLTTKEIAPYINNLSKNLDLLKVKHASFSTLIPTETGLNKSIMDAVSNVREFLKSNNFHDYEVQLFGPDHKIKLKGQLCLLDSKTQTEISLYRSNGRGDYRIWFSELKSFASANEELALINKDGEINVLNLSKYDYSDIL